MSYINILRDSDHASYLSAATNVLRKNNREFWIGKCGKINVTLFRMMNVTKVGKKT